jgi:thioredoxin 1
MSPQACSPAPAPPDADSDAWVVCLCAQWCGTCRDYRAVIDTLAREFPWARFVWLDIEDEADVAGDYDVETFPTLLLADAAGVRFLGALLPQAAVLERMLQRWQDDPPPLLRDASAMALMERIRQAYAVGGLSRVFA